MADVFLEQNASNRAFSFTPSASAYSIPRSSVPTDITLTGYKTFYVFFCFVRSSGWSGEGYCVYWADVAKGTLTSIAYNATLASIRATASLSGSTLSVTQDWSDGGLIVLTMPVF